MSRAPLLSLLLVQLLLSASISYASPGSKPSTTKVDWPSPVADTEHYGLLLFDLLEYQSAGSGNSLNWDLVGWRGGDIHRLWVKSEGSYALAYPRNGEADLQLLYGRLVTAFFDAQVGARLEQAWGDRQNASRLSAALGLQGLALYMFELEAGLFVGESGHVAGRVSASKDFLFTQKAIAQLRLETNAATKRSPEFETGSGVNDLSLGLRLRYEFKREISPYVGVTWTKLYGETADLRKSAGGESSNWKAIGGLRLWF